MNYFLTIPFSFHSANIRSSDYMVGMPVMTAVAGMAHKVVEILNDSSGSKSIDLIAFNIVYFGLDRERTSPSRPSQFSRFGGKTITLPGYVDIQKGSGEAALTLVLGIQDDEEFKSAVDVIGNTVKSPLFEGLLSGVRFGGGDVWLGLPGEFGSRPLSISLSKDWGLVLKRLIRSYPTKGLLIESAGVLLSEYLTQHQGDEGMEPINGMLEILHASRVQRFESSQENNRPDEPENSLEDFLEEDNFDIDLEAALLVEAPEIDAPGAIAGYLGVLLPCVVGYHALSEIAASEYVAESVCSLVRAKILPAAVIDLSEHRAPWQSHFWSWRYIEEARLYLACTYKGNFDAAY